MEVESSWWVSNCPMAWPCGKGIQGLPELGEAHRALSRCAGGGVAKGLHQLLLLISEFEHKVKWSSEQNLPAPDWRPRGEPGAWGGAAHRCVSPLGCCYQPGPPKMSLPLACGRDRKKCGHSEKSTCSLTQFRGATQHRLQKPPLGSHSYSQTLGNGQRKRVFPSQPRSSDQRKASRPLVLNGARIIGRGGSGELCLHPWHRLFTLVQHFSDALSSCFTSKCYIFTGEERCSRFHAPVV